MRLKHNISRIAFVLVLSAFLMAGCKDTDDSDSIIPVGSYTDNWGGSHTFTETAWSDSWGSTYTVVKKNPYANYVIYQNDASNAFNPSKFSRVDFTQDSNDDLYFCQIAYDKDTAAEAEAVTDADSSDPGNGGCGISSWSKLTENP